jgi:hypothetical protein
MLDIDGGLCEEVWSRHDTSMIDSKRFDGGRRLCEWALAQGTARSSLSGVRNGCVEVKERPQGFLKVKTHNESHCAS